MSTTCRRPWASKHGPSRKQSVGTPARLPSDHSERSRRRKRSGTRVCMRVGISLGGANHMAANSAESGPGRQVDELKIGEGRYDRLFPEIEAARDRSIVVG